MKPGYLSQVFYFSMILLAFACASKKEDANDHHDHESNDETVWAGMDTFHIVMAETFHPFKDSANLDPVKTRAAEMAAVAKQWMDAPLPAKVDNDDVKSHLQKLNSQASTLAETVKTSEDDVIADQLTALHDTFHEIQEAWYQK